MFIQIKIVLIAFAFYFAKVVKFGRPKMILNVKNILITWKQEQMFKPCCDDLFCDKSKKCMECFRLFRNRR